MKTRLQNVGSRVLEITLGGILGFFGLLSFAMGIAIGVGARHATETGSGNPLAGSVMIGLAIPAILYAARLISPRLRAWHGSIVGPLGFEILGVYLLILPVWLALTRQWGHLLLQLAHVGGSTTCFALARARRRSAREPHATGPAPITPE